MQKVRVVEVDQEALRITSDGDLSRWRLFTVTHILHPGRLVINVTFPLPLFRPFAMIDSRIYIRPDYRQGLPSEITTVAHRALLFSALSPRETYKGEKKDYETKRGWKKNCTWDAHCVWREEAATDVDKCWKRQMCRRKKEKKGRRERGWNWFLRLWRTMSASAAGTCSSFSSVRFLSLLDDDVAEEMHFPPLPFRDLPSPSSRSTLHFPFLSSRDPPQVASNVATTVLLPRVPILPLRLFWTEMKKDRRY